MRAFAPLFFIALFLLVDWYGFQAIKTVFGDKSPTVKSAAFIAYWAITAGVLLFFLSGTVVDIRHTKYVFIRYLFGVVIALFVSKLVINLFLLVDDLLRLGQYVLQAGKGAEATNGITRSKFISTLALATAVIPFSGFIWGMFKSAYNYQIHTIRLKIKNLPAAFEGFKIVQVSDIHCGSYTRKEPILEGIKKINALNADIFVFTGDLVNDIATEVDDYIDVFKQITAKEGKYSCTGNHDYGDYVQWSSKEEKRANFQKLMDAHGLMGFQLLMNEHKIFEKDGAKLALIGIENWGHNLNFPKYGKLHDAYKGTEDADVKVLLSHDPSHWDAQVRTEFPNIDLMLAGHTHGFQLGIETKYFKFSPSQFVYKQWAGLYQEASQYLYVNRGFGFLGYPGRVGILPEVTEIILEKA